MCPHCNPPTHPPYHWPTPQISDVDLAAASQALLVGFNLEPTDTVQTHAKRLGVSIMTYKVSVDHDLQG